MKDLFVTLAPTGGVSDPAEIKTAYESNADTNAFTDADKAKLDALRERFLGVYPTLAALQSAHPSPQAGDWGNVDAGVNNEPTTYVWDGDDNEFIALANYQAPTNDYSNINGIAATQAGDTFTVEAGTGAEIVNDPANKKIIINAGMADGGDISAAATLSNKTIYNVSSGEAGYALTLPAIDGAAVRVGDEIELQAQTIVGAVTIEAATGVVVTGYMSIHDIHSTETFIAQVAGANAWRVYKKSTRIELKAAYAHNAISYPYLSTINRDIKTKAVAGMNIESLGLGPARNSVEGAGGYYLINSTDFDFYEHRNIKLMRLPILWENIQDDLYEPLQTEYLGYIKTSVEDALAAGCEVIIDLHNYAQYTSKQDGVKRYIGAAEVPYNAYFDVWKRIALEFGNLKGVHFCLMNEPTMGDADLPLWVEKQQELILILRDAGFANHLQISTNSFTSAFGIMQAGRFKLWENIYDPLNNWSLELHQYIDDNLDGGGGVVGNTLESDNTVEAYIRLKEVAEWGRRQGIKIHLGELGIAHDRSLYPVNHRAMYNLLRFIEDNADVFVSFTMWGGASRGWGAYAIGYFPHENQSTYDAAFETGTRAGNDVVTEFKTYDIENEAYDPLNLQLVKSFHDVNEQPPWADFVFDYEKGQYAGFETLDDVVSFSRASPARSLNKLGNYELFIEDEPRVTDLGLNLEPLRIAIMKTPLYDASQNVTLEPEFLNITARKNVPAPDGTNNGLRVTDDDTNGQHVMHYALISGEISEGEAIAASVSVRYVSERYAYFGFNGLGQNTVHDFFNSTDEKGAKEWVRLAMSGIKVGSAGAREIMWGHNDGTALSAGHIPNSFAGAFTSTDFALPQIERCEFTGVGEEYEGDGFATSPIVGSAKNAQREADNYQFKGDVLAALNGNFTIFMAWHEIPRVSCKMPIFKLNGVNLLQRNIDSSVGSPYVGLDSGAMTEANLEHFLGKKVAISVNKTAGEAVLYAQGADPVTITGLTLPEVTSASLGNHAGFNRKLLIAREAYTAAQIQQIIDFEV